MNFFHKKHVLPVLLFAVAVAGSYLFLQNFRVSLDRSRAIGLRPVGGGVGADFNAVLTHPDFWSRDGQDFTGKRYIGILSNANRPNSRFMKVWSSPLNVSGESGNRQVVYHKYFGWDNQPGPIYEWESWQREGNILRGFKFGGDVMNASQPYWPYSWMNTLYQPEFNRRSPEHYTCDTGSPVYGYPWPNLSAGQSSAVVKVSANPNTCYPKGDGNSEYVALNFTEDFDSSYSAGRQQKCSRDASLSLDSSGNAYNICLDAPQVGRFEQRYAYFDSTNSLWRYACEPLVYVWGYPESGPTNKFFRNGELRWTEFGQFNSDTAYHGPDENSFWSNGCQAVWNDSAGKGGWLYSGVYQIGSNFYNDKGGSATSADIVTGLPTPTSTTTTVPTSTTNLLIKPPAFQPQTTFPFVPDSSETEGE